MDAATADHLARAYREGRVEVLPSLVNTLARPLLAQAFRFVRDWDHAADLVQETWIRVVEAIERWDPARPFEPWIRTILRNLCLQHLARRRRRPATVPLEMGAERVNACPADRPDRRLELDELRSDVARALTRLPRTQHQAVAMVDIERRAHDEVAQILGVTPASLRVILYRGRRALAALLSREDRP